MDPSLSIDIRVKLLRKNGSFCEYPVLRTDCHCSDPRSGFVECSMRAVLELFKYGCKRQLPGLTSPDTGTARLFMVVEPLLSEYILIAFPVERNMEKPFAYTQLIYGIQVGAESGGLAEAEIFARLRDAYGAGVCRDVTGLSVYETARTYAREEPQLPCLNYDNMLSQQRKRLVLGPARGKG